MDIFISQTMTTDPHLFTVSELTGRIKSTLEGNFSGITLTGEVSNFKIHTSGHCYFTLKDDLAQISAVMWRSRVAHLPFTPENGMKVVARGKVSVYPVRGVYQIDVMTLQAAGVGELQAAFERLKNRLYEEGLFEEGHKLPLPEYPVSVGLVTSGTGAAVRDMINVLSRRAPYLEVILLPVLVQGPGAAAEIAGAIRTFNEYGNVDLLIVGRGGGSMEDLWCFNEEVVARAIYNSNIPIVSAVGHEVDFTIADFVADLRAPTPSAAAELSVKPREELVENLANFYYTARKIAEMRVADYREKISHYLKSYAFGLPADLVRQKSQRLDDLAGTISRIAGYRMGSMRQHLTGMRKRLENLDPRKILERGFVIVSKGGMAVSSSTGVKPGDRFNLRFHDGNISGIAAKAVPEQE